MLKEVSLAPSDIRFMQDSISHKFQNGQSVNGVIIKIEKGLVKITDIPKIRVVRKDGLYYSLDNRRLYVYRVLQYRGKLDKIVVKLSSRRLARNEKFTTQNNGKSVVLRKGKTYKHFNALSPPVSKKCFSTKLESSCNDRPSKKDKVNGDEVSHNFNLGINSSYFDQRVSWYEAFCQYSDLADNGHYPDMKYSAKNMNVDTNENDHRFNTKKNDQYSSLEKRERDNDLEMEAGCAKDLFSIENDQHTSKKSHIDEEDLLEKSLCHENNKRRADWEKNFQHLELNKSGCQMEVGDSTMEVDCHSKNTTLQTKLKIPEQSHYCEEYILNKDLKELSQSDGMKNQTTNFERNLDLIEFNQFSSCPENYQKLVLQKKYYNVELKLERKRSFIPIVIKGIANTFMMMNPSVYLV